MTPIRLSIRPALARIRDGFSTPNARPWEDRPGRASWRRRISAAGHVRPTVVRAAVLLCLAHGGLLFGAGALDLKRLRPVPPNEPIPVQDFFRPPRISGLKLSPDGSHLAARLELGDDHIGLIVDDLANNQVKALGGYGDEDIYDYTWLDDRRLLFFLSSNKLYAEGVLVADIRHLYRCYPLVQWDAVDLVGIPRAHPLEPVIWIREDAFYHGEPGAAVRLDARLDGGPLIQRGPDNSGYDRVNTINQSHVLRAYPTAPGGMAMGYLAGPSGELEYAVTESNASFGLYRFAGGKWRKSPVDLATVNVLGAGNEPGQLVVVGPWVQGAPAPVRFMDAATGKPGTVLLQEKGYDFTGTLVRDPNTGRILGARYSATGPKQVWFTKTYADLQGALERHFGGLGVRILGSDRARTRYLVETYSDRQPPTYYVFDPATRHISIIEASRPWIDPARMQPMEIMKYHTADGAVLDAYVTLPVGASRTHPVPLVVMPHGGPWVRDTWGFDPEAQFLASRGYAVLQPNYRGSPGYDWEFSASDSWAFRKMSDDVTQATRTLLKTGFIDSTRVAIMGGSFGGYLAVAGVAFEPRLYRCAITIDGVFDWARMIKDDAYNQRQNARYTILRRNLGDPAQAKATFEALSPLRHVDEIRAPVFIAHGKDDPVVNIDQSRALARALKRAHVPCETMFAAGEGHGMLYLNHQVELQNRVLEFLAKYMGPVGK